MAKLAERKGSKEMQIICARVPNCGFRADDRYFHDKSRFYPGVCPRCNGPVAIVGDNTDTVISGAKVDTNPGSPTYREVVTG